LAYHLNLIAEVDEVAEDENIRLEIRGIFMPRR